MEIANLIVRILEAIAWPLTVIIIMFIFKSQLGRVILTLSKLRYKDLEIEFDKDLKDAEYKARELQLPSPEDIKGIPEAVVPTSPYDRLSQIAAISPRAAVTEAWQIIELSTMEAAKAQGITVRGARAEREVIRSLVKRAKLQEGTLDLYENLRRMRNNAVHAHEFEIDTEEAIRYVDLALSLAYRVRMSVNE